MIPGLIPKRVLRENNRDMNLIDLLIIIVLLFFALEGLTRTFIGELLDFLSFLLAFFVSLRFYNDLSGVLQKSFLMPYSFANVFGFLIIWFIFEVIFFSIVHLVITRLPVILRFSHHLRAFSFIPAILRGLVFIAIVLVLVASFPVQPKIKIQVQESKIGSIVLSQAHNLETPLKNVFGGITQDTMTFFTIRPQSDESVDLGFSTSEFGVNSGLETRMIELVNKERTSRGLNALEFDAKLTEVGRSHSSDMFKRGYFSHYSPENKNVADRASGFEVEFMVIGENLAYAPNLDLAHTGLMNSPGHRANILSSEFNKIGIGIMDGGVYGLMVTQVFSN